MSLIPSMPPKDPSAILPYTQDWTSWLGATALIALSTWDVSGPDAALVIGTGARAPTIAADSKSATVWLLGGTTGKTYVVTNHVTTDESPAREDDRSFTIRIEER